MKRINIALLSVILAITITSCLDEHEFKERPTVDPPAPTEHFASGADISGVTEFEAKGVKFYNKAGEERECTACERIGDEYHPSSCIRGSCS